MRYATDTTGDVIQSSLFNFLPKQQQAFEAMADHRYILYGGARGPGKSYFLRWAAVGFLIDAFRFRGLRGVRVGLFCETYPDLRDRQISKMTVEFPLWLGEVKETQKDGLCFFLREGYGGGIVALRNLDDPSKYQSAEFAAIFVDELTKSDFLTFDILRGSMRWPGITHTVFVAATNPGGIGHAWVKGLWIDKVFPPQLAEKKEEFAFIQALPADNPYLDQSYWEELNSLQEPLRSAWVSGNWDVFQGMAFPGWDRSRHVIEPISIPDHWPRWRAIDSGYNKPFCCLWLTRNPDTDRIYVYRESYRTELTDRQQARLITSLSIEPILITYADPSMWARKNANDLVTSSADEYRAESVQLVAGDNDRLNGKRKVDRLLGNLPDGAPGLQVFSTCVNLIRTLPAMPYDQHQVEDVDTDAEDHAYDALRYGLTNTRIKQVQPALPEAQPLKGIKYL